jgi:hypothetical protein
MIRSRLVAPVTCGVLLLVLGSSALALADPGNGNSANHARGRPFVAQQETSTPTSTATSTPTATATGTPTSTPGALDERPGLGCGDENHIHTGARGNPGNTCSDDHGRGNDGDEGE